MKILTLNHLRIVLPDSVNVDRLINDLRKGRIVDFEYKLGVFTTPRALDKEELEISVLIADKIYSPKDLPKYVADQQELFKKKTADRKAAAAELLKLSHVLDDLG